MSTAAYSPLNDTEDESKGKRALNSRLLLDENTRGISLLNLLQSLAVKICIHTYKYLKMENSLSCIAESIFYALRFMIDIFLFHEIRQREILKNLNYSKSSRFIVA